MSSPQASGGFFQPSLLSPPLSYTSSSASTSLPHPRSSPLRSGGTKESSFIRYIDSQILHIQRRFAKRSSLTMQKINGEQAVEEILKFRAGDLHDVKGYANMAEAFKDTEAVVSMVWISGTPSLQIPYIINLALLASTMIAAFPPNPKSLFRLLGKLDHAFASLLQGRDVDTGEPLPGYGGRKGVSGTEKVRVRSLVERTRIAVVEAIKKGEFDFSAETEGGSDKMESDGDDLDGGLVVEGEVEGMQEEKDALDMQIARVYDRTVVELGDSLEAPSIGIITEGRG